MSVIELVDHHPFLALLATIFVFECIYLSVDRVTRALVGRK